MRVGGGRWSALGLVLGMAVLMLLVPWVRSVDLARAQNEKSMEGCLVALASRWSDVRDAEAAWKREETLSELAVSPEEREAHRVSAGRYFQSMLEREASTAPTARGREEICRARYPAPSLVPW
jgi:hypothetical protein